MKTESPQASGQPHLPQAPLEPSKEPAGTHWRYWHWTEGMICFSPGLSNIHNPATLDRNRKAAENIVLRPTQTVYITYRLSYVILECDFQGNNFKYSRGVKNLYHVNSTTCSRLKIFSNAVCVKSRWVTASHHNDLTRIHGFHVDVTRMGWVLHGGLGLQIERSYPNSQRGL